MDKEFVIFLIMVLNAECAAYCYLKYKNGADGALFCMAYFVCLAIMSTVGLAKIT